MSVFQEDRKAAILAMRMLLSNHCLVLDTETTGLDKEAEVIQVAVIDWNGETLLDTYVKPSRPILEGGKAFEINRIGNKDVEDAPAIKSVLETLYTLLLGQFLAIYNAPFDLRMIHQSAHYAPPSEKDTDWFFMEPLGLKGLVVTDVMKPYAAYVGDWSDYFGNYRYQKLPGGGHSALEDCRATLALIKRMAATPIAVEAE